MILWPDSIPLPQIAAQGHPQNASLVSDPSVSGLLTRRARFQYSTYSLSPTWVLTIAQYDALETFYDDTLFNGAACFQIELRYPNVGNLTPWLVRFLSQCQAEYAEGLWNITADFELVKQLDINNVLAPLIDEQFFFVKQPAYLTDETKDVQLVTSDGFYFSVQQ